MSSKGRTIAHRLYLSALVFLLVAGGAAVSFTAVVVVHDQRVTSEDRQCFESGKPKPLRRLTRAQAAELGAVELSPEDAAESDRLRTNNANRLFEKCHFTEFGSTGHSHRAWVFPNPTTNWGATAALSLLAFLPAALLWVGSRWIRWVFGTAQTDSVRAVSSDDPRREAVTMLAGARDEVTAARDHPRSALALNRFAVTSLVMGVIAWPLIAARVGWVPALIAIVTGHLARRQLGLSPRATRGDGIALAGLFFGYGVFAVAALAVGAIVFRGDDLRSLLADPRGVVNEREAETVRATQMGASDNLVTVSLTTQPVGASVVEGDVVLGKTPLEQKWTIHDAHTLTFSLPGFVPVKRTFWISQDQGFEIELSPIKAPGTLKKHTGNEAQLYE